MAFLNCVDVWYATALLHDTSDCKCYHAQSRSSAAMERPSKAARAHKLNNLRARIPYLSQSALAAILAEAKREPLPDVASRTTIRNAEASAVAVSTPYGDLHQRVVINDSLEVAVCMPAPMLYHCAQVSASVKSLLQRRLSQQAPTPSAPWGAILYLDEVVPGNPLAHRNARKTWAVYWSIKEFGAAVLSDEDM